MKRFIRMATTVCMAICLLLNATVAFAAAAESPAPSDTAGVTAESVAPAVDKMASSSNETTKNGFVWKQGYGSGSLTLTESMVKVSHTGAYGLFGHAGWAVVTLRNTATKEVYSFSLYCNGGTITSTLAHPYPAGEYTYSVEHSCGTLAQLTVNFLNR